MELNRKGHLVSGRIIPIQQKGFGVPEYDPRLTSTDLIRLLSKEDFPGTDLVVAQDGTLGRKGSIHRIKGVQPRTVASSPGK